MEQRQAKGLLREVAGRSRGQGEGRRGRLGGDEGGSRGCPEVAGDRPGRGRGQGDDRRFGRLTTGNSPLRRWQAKSNFGMEYRTAHRWSGGQRRLAPAASTSVRAAAGGETRSAITQHFRETKT